MAQVQNTSRPGSQGRRSSLAGRGPGKEADADLSTCKGKRTHSGRSCCGTHQGQGYTHGHRTDSFTPPPHHHCPIETLCEAQWADGLARTLYCSTTAASAWEYVQPVSPAAGRT